MRFPVSLGLGLALLGCEPSSSWASPGSSPLSQREDSRRIPVQLVRVVDGDTLVVLLPDGQREQVRLIGMDAPESSQVPWGPRATRYLQRLLEGKAIHLVLGIQARDRYGRLLADVFAGGELVNLQLVRAGMAVLLTIPPNVERVDQLREAQAQARGEGLGVWDPREPLPESPQAYRRRQAH